MANMKKVDCALLPPCARTVARKLQRAQYVSVIWGTADSPYPGRGLDPLDFGWKLNNGVYVPDWFEGPAIPVDILTHDPGCSDQQRDEQFEDANSELPWSDDSESELEQ